MKRSYILRKLKRPEKKVQAGARKGVSTRERKRVRDITGGRCHVCGDKLGRRWQADHVVAVKLGGDSDKNFLPICKTCNRLRWHYAPAVLRMILQIGVYAKREILSGSALGKQLLEMTVRRSNSSRERRRSA